MKFRKLMLLLGDVLVLYFSLWTTLSIRYYKELDYLLWQRHITPFSFIFFLWILIFFSLGFYEIEIKPTDTNFISNFIKAIAINIILAIVFFYIFTPKLGISPKTILFLILLIFSPLFVVWHKLYGWIMKSTTRNNIMIIAETIDEQTKELVETINNNPQLGYTISIILENDFYNLREKVVKNNIKTVITSINPHFNNVITHELFDCLVLKIDIFSLADFYEKVTGKVPIASIGKTWFLENIAKREQQLEKSLKRILDIFLSIIVLIFTGLLLPFISFAIKWETAGNIFYSQGRMGQNGRIFYIVKFRSMYINAESQGAQWARENDSRITAVGNFLRKTRLDELPQAWNVLKGEMSFVGPRPERPEFISTLQDKIPYYQQRLLVKPGLTGWAQIKFPYGASERDALEKLQYDLYYIKNQKISLDLSIILKTIKIVINAQGR